MLRRPPCDSTALPCPPSLSRAGHRSQPRKSQQIPALLRPGQPHLPPGVEVYDASSRMSTASSPHLDVATPERVALTLPVAGIGYRCLAWLVDASLLFFFWVVAYFVFTLLVSDVLGVFQALSGLAR